MLGLLTAAASAASAIVYLAHKGNAQANWFAICQQFNSFCERISGSLIGSFGAIIVFILLVLLSAVALSRHWWIMLQGTNIIVSYIISPFLITVDRAWRSWPLYCQCMHVCVCVMVCIIARVKSECASLMCHLIFKFLSM